MCSPLSPSARSRPGADPRLRWGRRAILLTFAVLALAPRLTAQTSDQRLELERFRDSVGGTVDSVGLLALEQRMIAKTKVDRNNALSHLKLGFLSLRIGELGGQSHYEDAASEFQWAIDLKPDWPYSWYGMGLAEYGIGDSQVSFVTGIKTMLGKDALTRSAVAFAKSAQVDPAFDRGLVELANTALRQRVNIKLNVALDALRRSATTPSARHTDVLLARGRVEREVGDGDSALVAFQGYLQEGGSQGLGQLEVARTLFLLGRFDGTGPYYEGAANDDSVSVAGYRADLATIASDSVLHEFDQTSGPRRAAYLRQFWTERDQSGLHAEGERLREHYRRLFYARKNFQLVSLNRHYDIVERYRSGSRDFDDRGIIYIRHGEPTSRATYAAPGLEPNESWRYSRPDGDLIFHFMAREDVQDFKLVESLFDVLGFSNAVVLRGGLGDDRSDPVTQQLLLSREQLAPIYAKLQATGQASSGQFQSEERAVGQESIAVGTTTDSYELRFPDELKVHSEVLAVGRDSTGTQVQIAYAVAGSSLQPVMVTRGYLYSIRVRFVALDRLGRVAASVDTTRHFVSPAPVPGGEHLVGRVNIPVPPGNYTYRLAVQEGEDAGVVLPRDSLRVGRPTSATLALSDLVLGNRSTNLYWRRNAADTVVFNPLRTFRRNEDMELYYEVEGVAAGSKYDVRIAVRKQGKNGGLLKKVFGGGSAQLSLKFDETAAFPITATHRSLRLNKLKPGNYSLEVEVEDGQGRRDRRAQAFTVVDDKKTADADSNEEAALN
ncbi:MAG TPA: GWxTD domain-containing protein [Gemmatimonadales bacterium]|nr:GWxTD domain-containing protein [Gemmatimonadales bacterium]